MTLRRAGNRQAFLIGWVSGARASFGPVALALSHGKPPSALRRIRSGVSLLSAGSEVVVDKLPQTPSRLKPGALGARMVSGGVAAAGLARRRGEPLIVATSFGAAGALAGSLAGNGWRRLAAKHAPDWQAGVAEDALAALLAWGVTRRLNAPDGGEDVPTAGR